LIVFPKLTKKTLKAPRLNKKITKMSQTRRHGSGSLVMCWEGVRHSTTPIQKDTISFRI